MGIVLYRKETDMNPDDGQFLSKALLYQAAIGFSRCVDVVYFQ